MNFNAVLEIVISIAALFWLLSTVCSFVIEALNSLVRNVRANALERFICEMVVGDGGTKSLYAQFKGKLGQHAAADPLGLLSHGLIASLRKPEFGAGGDGTPPSYIPAQAFARAMLDRLASLAAAVQTGADKCLDLINLVPETKPVTGGPVVPAALSVQLNAVTAGTGLFASSFKLAEGLMSLTPSEAQARIADLKAQLANAMAQQPPPLDTTLVASRAHLDSFLDTLDVALRELAKDPKLNSATLGASLATPEALWLLLMRQIGSGTAITTGVFDAVREVVQHAPLPASLREVLRPIVANANFDLEALRKGVEDWYDGVMERASGWFKRHTALLLGGCGLLLGAALHINPILIAVDLSKDPDLRRAGVAFAEDVEKQNGSAELGQKIMFARAAKRFEWDACVGAVSSVSAASGVGPHCPSPWVLAGQMQTLLLRSGEYVGSMNLLRTPTPGAWSQAEREKILAGICTAWVNTEIAAGREVKPHQIQLNTQEEMVRWRKPLAESPCAPVHAAFDDVASDSRQIVETFWRNPEFVWDVDLASALAQIPASSSPLPADKRAALTPAFNKARANADEANARASDFLGRIPSLGWEKVHFAPLALPTGLADSRSFCAAIWRNLLIVVVELVGWLLTGVMVSFGAAFWFDLLSKAVNRRVTGPRPAAMP